MQSEHTNCQNTVCFGSWIIFENFQMMNNVLKLLNPDAILSDANVQFRCAIMNGAKTV